MRALRILGIALAAVAGAAGTGVAIASCAATPTNVPVRTFEQAKNVDYLCVAVNDPATGAVLPPARNVGLAPGSCAQVPPNTNGAALPNHVLALVTQTTRGEVAVVDLTAGAIVDQSHATPGVNFIPVGTSPTGIVVGADAQMTFVSSADPNKPAIYGIPTAARGGVAGVLGDSLGSGAVAPLALTDLPACALPQPPQTISVASVAAGDGGPAAGYVLVAVLQRSRGQSAKVVAIDPTGLLRGGGVDAGAEAGAAATPGVLAPCPVLGGAELSGRLPGSWSAGPAWPDGVPYADAGDLSAQLPPPGPGPSCSPPTDDAGGDDAAADAGAEDGALPVPVDPFSSPLPASAAMRDDLPVFYVGDAELPVIHVFDLSNPTRPRELAPLLATSLAQPSRHVAVGALAISPPTREYQRFLYAVDSAEGSVMVFDVTDPATSPRTPMQRPHAELNPLVPRDRLSFSSPVATLTFVRHDWPITPVDKVHAFPGLLCNPNPNAVVNAPPPPVREGGVEGGVEAGATSVADAGAFLDNGAYYRADQAGVPVPSGTVQGFPLRLRGVFGFVTLTTGQMVAIDVDDWDAPCRRPDPMAIVPILGAGMTGLLDIPEPEAGPPGSPTFLDPYHAPFTEPPGSTTAAVTLEAFFPVSAPNRMRSSVLLRNDPSSGNHMPNVSSAPQLTDQSGAPVTTSPQTGVAPLIMPTPLPEGFVDPSLVTDPTVPYSSRKAAPQASTLPAKQGAVPAVRLSFDDPTASQDQDWTVTYEGALPTTSNVSADVQAPGPASEAYETLTLTIGQQVPDGGAPEAGYPAPGVGPGFCERGVEDWDIGQARAKTATAAMSGAGLAPPPDLPAWTADYVQVEDDLLPQGDPYWAFSNDCWEGLSDGKNALGPTTDGGTDPPGVAAARYNACNQTFGAAADADVHLGRDLPILAAYDDHLDVGRFYWPPGQPEQTTSRVVVGKDPGSKNTLRFVSCCFHKQVTFRVRAGGEWVASGQNGIGFLHHVVAGPVESDPLGGGAPGRRCVLSCDPHDVLLNARSFDVPWAPIPWGAPGAAADAGAAGAADAGRHGSISCALPMGDAGALMAAVDRNGPLAMHNPFFSYVTWMGCGLPASPADHTLTPRGHTWKFQLRGGFSPLVVSLTGGTAASISPQSMRFIEPLGQVAVVDGQSQGLVLVDLNSLGFAHAPYF
jgi:hypothetical protein